MSMHLSVYVGPYIEAWDFDNDLVDRFEGVLADGRGEAREKGEHRFLIPNADLPGVNRQMSFSRNDDTPAISIPAISNEVSGFEYLAKPFMEAVRESGGECKPMQWGVVCGIW